MISGNIFLWAILAWVAMDGIASIVCGVLRWQPGRYGATTVIIGNLLLLTLILAVVA